MRWRWWRPEPMPGEDEHRSWPDHGLDESGRLIDGDNVRPDGWHGWQRDLLDAEVAEAAAREIVREPTQLLPTLTAMHLTPAQQWRANGGRHLPRSGSHG